MEVRFLQRRASLQSKTADFMFPMFPPRPSAGDAGIGITHEDGILCWLFCARVARRHRHHDVGIGGFLGDRSLCRDRLRCLGHRPAGRRARRPGSKCIGLVIVLLILIGPVRSERWRRLRCFERCHLGRWRQLGRHKRQRRERHVGFVRSIERHVGLVRRVQQRRERELRHIGDVGPIERYVGIIGRVQQRCIRSEQQRRERNLGHVGAVERHLGIIG